MGGQGEAHDGTLPCLFKLATEGAHARVEATFVSSIQWSRKWALCGQHCVHSSVFLRSKPIL